MSIDLTRDYCSYQSGILIIDGKYVKVKDYPKKIPWLYAIDYVTHDILFGILAREENGEAFLEFFRKLKTTDYSLRAVVADDRSALPLALKQVYPGIPLQLCQNHYLENIRQELRIRTDQTHGHFFNSLKKHLFEEYEDEKYFQKQWHYVFQRHCQTYQVRQAIMMAIARRRTELFAYKKIQDCPNNTNLIELFNSHFNARIRSFKGFKTREHAELILNGLIIRRRTKEFTDCGKKFERLNGKCSLQMSIKKQAKWPEIYGVNQVKNQHER